MFRKAPSAREKYVALDRAAEVLRLAPSQLTQFLVTGQILASVIYHKPSDFKDQREVELADGSKALRTRISRTELRFRAPGHDNLPLMYLDKEDTARILLNTVANRQMIVNRLFYDSTLTPKRGLRLVGDSAIAISPGELVVASEELGRFAKAARIRIRPAAASALDLPQKPWYDRPVGRTVLGIVVTIVGGVCLMIVRKMMTGHWSFTQ